MKHLLFSYGTLQLENVQIESFGRKLKGIKGKLTGFKIEQLEITDPYVLETSNQKYHPIALHTGNKEDFVEGMAFEITDEELLQADKYEVDDYKRISAKLESSEKVWVYVEK